MSIAHIANHISGKENPCVNTLEKIQGKTASRLLQEYGISKTPPIDLAGLLEKIGISTISMDFTEAERITGTGPGSILSAAYSNGERLGIFFRDSDPWRRQKFTVAHELAYCCLYCPEKAAHIAYRPGAAPHADYDETKEKNADIFAGELLIPSDMLRKYYNKFLIPSLRDLSDIFGISASVMAGRLDCLHMAYYKDTRLSG